jgi:hypothetical protein
VVEGEVLDAGADLVVAAFAAAVHGHPEHEGRGLGAAVLVPAVAAALLAHDRGGRWLATTKDRRGVGDRAELVRAAAL